MLKPRILFVGSFAPMANDGTVGGQMYACRALLDSPLSSSVEWLLIDSTMKSLPPPNYLKRAYYACRRLIKFTRYLVLGPVDAIFIFTAYEFASFLEKGLMALFGRVCGKRVILSLRSEIRPFSHDRWTSWFRLWILRLCTAVVCQSEHAARNLAELLGYRGNNIVIISNWIDSGRYQRWKTNGGPAKSIDRPLNFLFLGWLEAFKGIQETIGAAQMLAAKGLAFRLVVCGNGSLSKTLQADCARLGLEKFIEFRGWVTDEAKMKVFEEADVLLLPSYSEGLPNALLEAMAAGLAVITTPVGGIPSLINDDVNGLLVKPRDQAELARAMEKLLMNRTRVEVIGETNRRVISQQHDISQVWPRIAKILDVAVEVSAAN